MLKVLTRAKKEVDIQVSYGDLPSSLFAMAKNYTDQNVLLALVNPLVGQKL